VFRGYRVQTPPIFPFCIGLAGRPHNSVSMLHLPKYSFVQTGYLHVPAKGKGSPYSITERRVPELIPVLGSQPAGDISHKPSGRLPLLSARPAVTLAILKRTATNFAAW